MLFIQQGISNEFHGHMGNLSSGFLIIHPIYCSIFICDALFIGEGNYGTKIFFLLIKRHWNQSNQWTFFQVLLSSSSMLHQVPFVIINQPLSSHIACSISFSWSEHFGTWYRSISQYIVTQEWLFFAYFYFIRYQHDCNISLFCCLFSVSLIFFEE